MHSTACSTAKRYCTLMACVATVAATALAGPYGLELVRAVALWIIYVTSWQLYCGPMRQSSFGHSLFVGGAAYVYAITAGWAGGPVASVAVALAAAAAAGAAVSWAAERLHGPAFALLTMVLQLAFFQALFLFPNIFGGEQGLVALPLVDSHRGGVALTVAAALALIASGWVVSKSGFWLRVRAIGDDAELARSSGVRVGRIRAGVMAASAGAAGIGGVLGASGGGLVVPELAGAGLSVEIVLLGVVASRTIGVPLAVALLVLTSRLLVGAIPADRIVYAAVLVVVAAAVGAPSWRHRRA